MPSEPIVDVQAPSELKMKTRILRYKSALCVLPDTRPVVFSAGNWPAVVTVSVPPLAKANSVGKSQHLSRLTVHDRELYAPGPFEALGRTNPSTDPRLLIRIPEPASRLKPVLLHGGCEALHIS